MDPYIHEIEQASKHYQNTKNDYNRLSVLEHRNIDHELKNIIDKITLQQSPSPVGTFRYAVIKFPGDIDMMEKITSPLPRQDFLQNMVFRLKAIIESIILSDNIFFIEFKAGEDHRFKFDAESASDQEIMSKIDTWHSDQWITDENRNKLLELFNIYSMSNNKSEKQKMRDDILLQIREFKMLRWTAGEILSGRKKLLGPGDKYMTLYEALDMPTVTKLDTVIWYDSRYVELTNFFYLELINELTKEITIVSQPFGNHIEALTSDIKKYLGCDDDSTYDILKALKRVFIKDATIYKRNPRFEILDEMNELARIINDVPGALSQIKADFGALESILKVIPNFNMKNMSIMLNSMMKRINNNILNPDATELFNKTKDDLFKIYAEYQMYTNMNDTKVAEEKKQEYISVLKKFISEWTGLLKEIINATTKNRLSASIGVNKLNISCDNFGTY
jgi:hypothetical protein